MTKLTLSAMTLSLPLRFGDVMDCVVAVNRLCCAHTVIRIGGMMDW